jgi:endonuclease YncB( thermonuclease family)
MAGCAFRCGIVVAGLIAGPLGLALAEPVLAVNGAVSSYAFVNDDGSLRISGRTYRLHGIHIPPSGRTCRADERPAKCGSRAALALDFRIDGDFVRCEPLARRDDGTISAVCSAGGVDLAAYLLERGWALALPDAPFEYQALERIARHRGIGVWGFPIDPRP